MREEALDPYERAARDASNDAGGAGSYETQGLKGFFARLGKRFEICDFFEEMAPDEHRGSMASGPGQVFRCPNDDAHSDAGNDKDVGFFCINASEIEDGGAVAKCQHDSCQGLDRLNFVDLFCRDHGITDANELKKWTYREADDTDYAEEAAPENFETLKSAALALTKNDAKGASALAQRVGRSKLKPVMQEGLLKQIKEKTGISTMALRKEARHVQNAKNDLNDEAISALQAINSQGALVTIGSDIRFMRYPDVEGETPTLLRMATFVEENRPRKIMIGSAEEQKVVPLTDVWRDWSDRKHYKSLVFEPPPKIARPGSYNIFQGFREHPRGHKGWRRLRSHIWRNMCHRNRDWYDWVVTWMADIIQFPGRKMGSALITQGDPGSGKGEFWRHLRVLLSPYSMEVAQRSHLTGNFNKHQWGKLLVVADEANWAGDNDASEVLKNKVTSEDALFEGKGLDVIEGSDYARVGMASNKDWVVKADEDSRRFMVLKLANGNRKDAKFFATIDEEMKGGGYAAMMADLKAWMPPGGGWDILRNPPVTPWLQIQVEETSDLPTRFLRELVENGWCNWIGENDHVQEVPILLSETKATFVSSSQMLGHLIGYVKVFGKGDMMKHGQTQALATAAKKVLGAGPNRHRATSGSREQTRGYMVPPLNTLRGNRQ